MPKLVYIPPGVSAPRTGDRERLVRVPPIQELDYEIGEVRPWQPFEVEEHVARWMLGPRGNPNFHRHLEHDERGAPELLKGERRVIEPAIEGPLRRDEDASVEQLLLNDELHADIEPLARLAHFLHTTPAVCAPVILEDGDDPPPLTPTDDSAADAAQDERSNS